MYCIRWMIVSWWLLFSSGFGLQLFPELSITFEDSTDPQCAADSKLISDHLKNLTLWAYEMWESSAHTPVGLLTGNTHQLGHFDECLKTKAPFRVQYCLVQIEMHIPNRFVHRIDKYSMNYNPNASVFEKFYFTGDKSRVPRNVVQMALCVPYACEYNEIQNVLNAHMSNYSASNQEEYNLTYTAKLMSDTCQTDRSDEPFTSADISFCLLIAIIVILTIVCTIYDMKRTKIFPQQSDTITKSSQRNSVLKRICLCFSAVKNFHDLSRKDDTNPALGILYGMRTLSIFMIIIDHRCGTFLSTTVFNREFVEQHYRSWTSLFIFHGDLFVDSFFLLSGLLVTYSLLVSFEKRVTAPWLIILNRYVRLTPIFAIVIFFYATMLYRTGSGPLWKSVVGSMQQDCQQNWWAALLYLGNYVNDGHMCMVHSWYLPCDFHYFILAIPTILLLKRKQQTGLIVLLIALVISLLIPFAITFYYKRPALLHFYSEFLTAPTMHPDFRLTYTKTHTRAAAYIVGMFTGYAYYKLRHSTFKLSLIKSSVLTFIGFLLMFIGMASGAIFYDPYHSYNALEAALYAALHRPVWALGSAIVLLTASYGHFNFLKVILEWNPWIPLSKLVYGAYLVHMCWQLRSAALAPNSQYLNEVNIITRSFGDIVFSFALALVLYITIETPCRKIFRVLISSPRTRHEPKQEINLTENVVHENSRL